MAPTLVSRRRVVPRSPLTIMVYAIALFSNLLLASAALAAPSRLEERIARRRAGRQSQPIRFIDNGVDTLAANKSHVEYSENWAGAVWDSYPSVRILCHHPNLNLTACCSTGNFQFRDRYFYRPHSLRQLWRCIGLGWY